MIKVNNPIIAIPTGNRLLKAKAVAKAWKEIGYDIVVYTWDEETKDLLSKITPYIIFDSERKSYAISQNIMAASFTGWDYMICGADDIYPRYTEPLKNMTKLYDGKLIWVQDGLFNAQMTHPVVTKEWYKNNKQIFDERFVHNFCDTDLQTRASQKGEIIRCFNVIFDHRHIFKTKEEPDELHKISRDTYAADEKRYYDKYKDSSVYMGFITTH